MAKTTKKTTTKAVEKVEKKVQDDVYRLEEMSDEINKSLENAKSVKAEQDYLVSTLTKLNDERLKTLTQELIKQDKELENQINVLSARYQQLLNVLEAAKDEKTRKVVNDLLAGLGVFSK